VRVDEPRADRTAAAVGPDCAVDANGPSSIDGVFANIPGFTVKRTCPADVDPAFAGPQFDAQFSADGAGDVAQNGEVVLKVFAGQLKSSRGDDFVHGFLSDLSTAAAPGRTVASEPKQVGGRQVTYFNVPVAAEGYAYAAGSTVVIAFDVAGGSHAETAKEAFAKVLDGLH